MRMIAKWILITITLSLSPLAGAATMAEFDKTCAAVKKKASLCQCLSANLKRRLEYKTLDEDHLPLAVQALKNESPGPEENSTYYDNLADFLAGLEPHCLKNPKYNSDQP